MALFLSTRLTHAQCTAAFTPTTGGNGTAIFINQSTPSSTTATSYWNFGNGTTTITTAGYASVQYTANGVYTVTLLYSTGTCSNVTTQTISITSVTACSLTASFTSSTGIAAGAIQFSNTSTGTWGGSTYSWNFGDGTPVTAGYSLTPSHTYTANGTYVVMLMVSNSPACTSGYSTTVNVSTAPTCTVVPAFTYSMGANGLVNFFNTSTGTTTASTYYWNFGNNFTSNQASPNNTYNANGIYTVTMIVSTQGCGTVQVTHTLSITNTSVACNLNANFSAAQGANGLVTFNNQSTNTSNNTTYTWYFGDGATSTATSPAHTYTANGTYVISLVANNNTTPGCTDSTHASVLVSNATNTNNPCNLSAGFTATQGTVGLVIFNNTSTGTSTTTSYSWTFGDGGTSSSSSPAHTYTANGSYFVLLTISNGTACSSSYSTMVNVSSICNLNASFSYSITGNMVYFFNTSTGTNGSSSYSWAFGDGSYGSGTYVSHTYSGPGSYNVSFGVTNTTSATYCADSAFVTVIIPTSTCVANASFIMMPSGTPHVYYAVPSNTAGIASASWSWGDGSSSSGLYTSHTYSAAGVYNICLTIHLTCGDSDTVCLSDTLSRNNGTNEMIQVNVVTPQQVAMGIKNNGNSSVAYAVSPNPASGNFNISITGLNASKARISVYNLVGSLIYENDSEVSGGSLSKEVQLHDAANGVYFVKVSDEHSVYTKKLIINK